MQTRQRPTKPLMTERHASPQAWRRLRRQLTDSELRDIAKDIAAVISCSAVPYGGTAAAAVYEALAVEPWEYKRQV